MSGRRELRAFPKVARQGLKALLEEPARDLLVTLRNRAWRATDNAAKLSWKFLVGCRPRPAWAAAGKPYPPWFPALSDHASPMVTARIGRLDVGLDVQPGHQGGIGGHLVLDLSQRVDLAGGDAVFLREIDFEPAKLGLKGFALPAKRVRLVAITRSEPFGREQYCQTAVQPL